MSELPVDYQGLSGEAKLDVLWERVCDDLYEGALPEAVPGAWGRRHLFSVGYDRVSFEHASDELPPERVKLVHRYGAHAKVRVEVSDARGYTGLVASGFEGLLRLSDATGGPVLTPSAAIKICVDGAPSINYFALPSAARSGKDRSFLTSALSNSSAAPTSGAAKLLVGRFQATAEALEGARLYGVYLPLHPLAETEVDGSAVAAPSVPDRIELHPTEEALAAYDDGLEWRASLAKIPTGTALYEMRAAPSLEAKVETIGLVRLTTPLLASRYGDERLFFQHHVGPVQR